MSIKNPVSGTLFSVVAFSAHTQGGQRCIVGEKVKSAMDKEKGTQVDSTFTSIIKRLMQSVRK